MHPGLEQRLREAEEAEKKGTAVRDIGGAQRITRPSLDATSEERAWQARTIGLVDPAYKVGFDPLQPLADQPAFRAGADLDSVWDTLSEAEKVRAGATERFRLEMEAALRRAAQPFEMPHQIGGRLDARNLKRSAANIAAEVGSYAHILAPDSFALLQNFIETTRALIDAAMRSRGLQGVDAVFVHEFLRDLARKLIYQELVSRRRGMGDRGIRRICGNIDLGDVLYGQIEPMGISTPRDRLLMRIIHVHQDLGHTAYAARVSYRGGRLHRAYGARIFTDEMNRLRPLLSPKELDLVRSSVATHSSEELPIGQDKVLAFTRAVDHLAPFAPHRVYKHLENVKGATDFLDDMLARAKAADGPRFAAARTSLRRFLAEQTDLPEPLRDDLIADFRPIDKGADYLDLGDYAGQVNALQVEPFGAGKIFVHVARDPFSRKYQGLFDHQQDQFLRLARTTKVNLKHVMDHPVFAMPSFGALDLEMVNAA